MPRRVDIVVRSLLIKLLSGNESVGRSLIMTKDQRRLEQSLQLFDHPMASYPRVVISG